MRSFQGSGQLHRCSPLLTRGIRLAYGSNFPSHLSTHRFGQAKPFNVLTLPSLKSGSRIRWASPQLCEERNDVYAKWRRQILEGERFKYLDALIDVSEQVVCQGKVHPEIQHSIAGHPANMLQELLRTTYTTKIAQMSRRHDGGDVLRGFVQCLSG
jgi:hypothetical protein